MSKRIGTIHGLNGMEHGEDGVVSWMVRSPSQFMFEGIADESIHCSHWQSRSWGG